jgi:hypothetical protein
MSANEISLGSPSRSCGSLTNGQAHTASQDTEMTCLLTSTESGSARSRSSSPKKDDMSYQPSRDRTERQGSSRPSASGSGRSSIGPGTMTFWRREETPGVGPSYQPSPGYYSSVYDPHSPMMTDSYGSPPPQPRGNSAMIGENSIPLSAVVPGSAFPTTSQLDVAYAYGIQREDGSYTRLIRADELSEMNNVPRGQGPEGLIILPSPRQIDPALRQGPEPMIPAHVSLYLLLEQMEQSLPVIGHSTTANEPPPRRSSYFIPKT